MHGAVLLPRLIAVAKELASLTHAQSTSSFAATNRIPKGNHEEDGQANLPTKSRKEEQKEHPVPASCTLSTEPKRNRGDGDMIRYVRFENKMAGQAGAGDRWRALRTFMETHDMPRLQCHTHTPCALQQVIRQLRMESFDVSRRK